MIEVVLFFLQVSLTSFIFNRIRKKLFSKEPKIASVVKDWLDDKSKAKLHQALSDRNPEVKNKLEKLAESTKKRNELSVEIKKSLNPSTFPEHHKNKRKIIELDDEITKETESLKSFLKEAYEAPKQGRWAGILKVLKFLFNLLRIAFLIFVMWLFRDFGSPIEIDCSLIYPFDLIFGGMKDTTTVVIIQKFWIAYFVVCFIAVNRLSIFF